MKLCLIFFCLYTSLLFATPATLSVDVSKNPLNTDTTVSGTLFANFNHSQIGVGSGYNSLLQYENSAPIEGVIPFYISYHYLFTPENLITPYILVQLGRNYFINVNNFLIQPNSFFNNFLETYYKIGIGIFF